MRKARIFRPDKTAMQSGFNKCKRWMLQFEPEDAYFVESLMGWTGMKDTTRELNYRLQFDSKEEAIAYAENNKIPYELYEPHPRKKKRKAYADNFAFNKRKA